MSKKTIPIEDVRIDKFPDKWEPGETVIVAVKLKGYPAYIQMKAVLIDKDVTWESFGLKNPCWRATLGGKVYSFSRSKLMQAAREGVGEFSDASVFGPMLCACRLSKASPYVGSQRHYVRLSPYFGSKEEVRHWMETEGKKDEYNRDTIWKDGIYDIKSWRDV